MTNEQEKSRLFAAGSVALVALPSRTVRNPVANPLTTAPRFYRPLDGPRPGAGEGGGEWDRVTSAGRAPDAGPAGRADRRSADSNQRVRARLASATHTPAYTGASLRHSRSER